METEVAAPVEEKRPATWGSDVPDDLELDQKLLAEALKKVTGPFSVLCSFFILSFPTYFLLKRDN